VTLRRVRHGSGRDAAVFSTAGLPAIRFQDMRHTSTTILLAKVFMSNSSRKAWAFHDYPDPRHLLARHPRDARRRRSGDGCRVHRIAVSRLKKDPSVIHVQQSSFLPTFVEERILHRVVGDYCRAKHGAAEVRAFATSASGSRGKKTPMSSAAHGGANEPHPVLFLKVRCGEAHLVNR
jgi:hypothetical protein